MYDRRQASDLQFSEAVETVIDEKSSEDQKETALLEIRRIAQKRGLPITRAALVLVQAWALDLDLARAWALDR